MCWRKGNPSEEEEEDKKSEERVDEIDMIFPFVPSTGEKEQHASRSEAGDRKGKKAKPREGVTKRRHLASAPLLV
jgi:hypothetical protein